jgi:hypothetical protein
MPKRPATVAPGDAVALKRTFTLEQVVNKKILDNFVKKGYTSTETDVRLGKSGKTLRATMLADWQDVVAKKIKTFDADYYKKMRDEYRPPVESHRALAPIDTSLPVSDKLIKALQFARRDHNPDRILICVYLSSTLEINATELCGLYRWFLSLKPGCAKQLTVCLECVKFVRRLGLKQKFAREFGVLRHWVDEVMVAALLRSRIVSKARDDKFIEAHKASLVLVIPEVDLQAVVDADGHYERTQVQLVSVCASSTVGLHLFETACHNNLALRAQECMQEQIDKYFGVVGVMTDEKLIVMMNETTLMVECIPGIQEIPAKRNIKIPMGPLQLTIQVSSLHEELRLRTSVAKKVLAVKQGSLRKMWNQDMLCDHNISPAQWKATIPASLVAEAEYARQMSEQMFDDMSLGARTADVVKKLMKTRLQDFLSMEVDFKIEAAMIELLTSDSDMGRYKAAILEKLPIEANVVSAASSAQQLEALASSKLFAMAPRTAQEKLKVIKNMVAELADDRQPNIDDAHYKCDFISSAIATFGYFLEFSQPASATDAAAPTLYGVNALKAIVAATEQKSADGDATLKDVDKLVAFRFLAKDDLAAKIDALAKTVHAAMCSFASKATASVKKSDKKMKDAKAAHTESSLLATMSLFS